MKVRKKSGVRGVVSVSHRERGTGQIHGHSYTVIAWFPFTSDVVLHQRRLNEELRRYDHTMLPDSIAWAEDLAEQILATLAEYGCYAVDVNREAEGFYAGAEIIRR